MDNRDVRNNLTFPMKTSGLASTFCRVYQPLCWNLKNKDTNRYTRRPRRKEMGLSQVGNWGCWCFNSNQVTLSCTYSPSPSLTKLIVMCSQSSPWPCVLILSILILRSCLVKFISVENPLDLSVSHLVDSKGVAALLLAIPEVPLVNILYGV